MEENIRKKYDRAAKIIGIIIGILFVLGISYAVFRTVTKGEQDSVISAGKLDVRIENEQDEITLENAFPITEEEGKKQTPYTFDVVNEGTINAEYDLYIEIDESVSTLPVDVVRYYLTVEEDGTEKNVTLFSKTISEEDAIEKDGKKLYKIDNKYLDTTKSNHYKLYLWIDEEATTEQAVNKRFEAKVSIEATQLYDHNRLVSKIDVSANNDESAIAYMYADGSVIIKGKGNLKNNLSDILVYMDEDLLSYYRRAFIAIGCDSKEVYALQTPEEIQIYMDKLSTEDSNINERLSSALMLIVMKDVLEDLGYDTSTLTEVNDDAFKAYLVKQGLMDEEGQFTEEGQDFYTKFEEKINELSNSTLLPFKTITLDEGITNIPEGLFTGNEDITEVRIPSTVTSIDGRAFFGCTGLKEVNIPSSVTQIGSQAFNNCSGVKKLTVDGTKEYYTFGMNNIEELVVIGIGDMPNSNFRYPVEPWYNSRSTIKKITIKEGITSIGSYMFQDCVNVTSIEIPNSVTTIRQYAFYNCSNLSTVIISKGVTSMDASAFSGCSNLLEYNVASDNATYTSVDGVIYNKERTQLVRCPYAKGNIDILGSVTSIGNSALEGCNKLTKIDLPNHVTIIENNAFSQCSNLTEINLPNGLTTIGNSAFFGCGMTSIKIPNQVMTIGSNAFYNCRSLISIELPDSVTSLGESAFYNCSNLESVVLSESLTKLEDATFSNCPKLESLSIPAAVSSIAFNAFNGNFNVSKENTTYTSIDGVLYNKAVTRLIKCPPAKTTIDIPNSITIIGDHAFSGSAITSIALPNSVTTIEAFAFFDSSITSITLSNNLTTIGDHAFSHAAITSITLPNSVTSLGMSAFSNSNLQSIVLSESLTEIKDETFYYCTDLLSVEIPNSVQTIGNGVFKYCSKLKTIVLSESLTNIGSDDFSNCRSLVSIVIPDSVTSIGSLAFFNCTSLTSITIPNSVIEVGSYVFNSWKSTQTINIDNTKVYVDDNWDNYWDRSCNAKVNYLRS